MSFPNPFSAAPSDPDEVALKIGGKQWRFWDDLELQFGIDTYSTVGFTAPFEVERQEFKNTFRPFSFKPMELTIGGEASFTGTMLDVVPPASSDARTVAVSGYSKPGVLECDFPVSLLPFETNGLTLEQIVAPIADAFGLKVSFNGQPGSVFKRAKKKTKKNSTEPDGSIQDFLVRLAQQRGFVLSNNAAGDLVFWKSVAVGSPVARLKAGAPPVLSVTPTFNAQEYFSEITGFVPHKTGVPGAKFTEKNSRLPGVLRPSSFQIDQTQIGDAPGAVRAALGRMFANAMTLAVELPTWRDPKGKLWQPNTTVKLLAPDAMVYTETEFLVRNVSLRRGSESKTATLGLVMPGAFSGEVPTRLPWD